MSNRLFSSWMLAIRLTAAYFCTDVCLFLLWPGVIFILVTYVHTYRLFGVHNEYLLNGFSFFLTFEWSMAYFLRLLSCFFLFFFLKINQHKVFNFITLRHRLQHQHRQVVWLDKKMNFLGGMQRLFLLWRKYF